jgi:hypothetical protein
MMRSVAGASQTQTFPTKDRWPFAGPTGSIDSKSPSSAVAERFTNGVQKCSEHADEAGNPAAEALRRQAD